MAYTNAEDGVHLPEEVMSAYGLATQSIHADDHMARATDVAPAMHVSTTYCYSSDPDNLVPLSEDKSYQTRTSVGDVHVYSRASAPTTSRLEVLLSSLLHGHSLTYSSGLSAFHALLVLFNAKHIAIGEGYHGCHGVLSVVQRLSSIKKIDLHDEASWDAAGLGKGDIVHVETPLNPTGEAYNLAHYADAAHKRGAYLTVDATFGPPGLQDPFEFGADIVMHAGTKYIGGHSDMLCGVLAVRKDRPDWWRQLYQDRVSLGAVMGNHEAWLGLRSLRTLELRVTRASESASVLVQWLDGGMRGEAGVDAIESDIIKKTVYRVQHASLQHEDMSWLKKQMPNGFGPVFAIWMKDEDMAKRLPSKLRLFHHATSLGGVESLIEWRRMSDATVDRRVLRVSIGVEDVKDLRCDLIQALKGLLAEQKREP